MKLTWEKKYKDGIEITPLDLRHHTETKKYSADIDDYVTDFVWRIHKKHSKQYILIANGKANSLSYAKSLIKKKLEKLK